MLVRYAIQFSELEMNDADIDMIKVVAHHHRVAIIKWVRARYGIGLYEAKQIVDSISPRPEVHVPSLVTEFRRAAGY